MKTSISGKLLATLPTTTWQKTLTAIPRSLDLFNPNYKCALEKVTPLFEKDKDFVYKLRREPQCLFQDITEEGIKEFTELELEGKTVEFLMSKFHRDMRS